jgi:hypothetical protein
MVTQNTTKPVRTETVHAAGGEDGIPLAFGLLGAFALAWFSVVTCFLAPTPGLMMALIGGAYATYGAVLIPLLLVGEARRR